MTIRDWQTRPILIDILFSSSFETLKIESQAIQKLLFLNFAFSLAVKHVDFDNACLRTVRSSACHHR